MRRLVLSAVLALAAACATPQAAAKTGESEASGTSSAVSVTGPQADRGQVPPLGPPPALKVPAQVHFTLGNGLKVRLVEYHRLPLVAMYMIVNAGTARDPEKLPGAAGFTAAMLTEGTTHRSSTRISDELGLLGASVGAGAASDAAFLTGEGLARNFGAWLDVFADVAMNPAFPAADFSRVQNQRLVGLLQQRDVPGAVAMKAFIDAFWHGTPYGHWAMGTEASVKATKPADLKAFHAKYWVPNNAELVVVGDLTAGELQPMLEAALGKWKAGTPQPPLAGEAPRQASRTVMVDKPGAPQAFVIVGMPGLARQSADFVKSEVAMQVLGGGSSSRLFRDLREEKGYTYGIYAREEAHRAGGVTTIIGSARADVTAPALEGILDQVEKLRVEPVPEAELADARNALALSLPAQFATASGIAGKVAEEAIYGLPDDYWNGYAQAVLAVTPADVQAVSQKILDPSALTAVLVTDVQAVKPTLSGLPIGDVEVREPAK